MIGPGLVEAVLASKQEDETEIAAPAGPGGRAEGPGRRRQWRPTATAPTPATGSFSAAADYLIKKSVWGVGGDGWAFDIGYGGLDHVLASQRNINLLVLNTQMYSNTGGQCSKATPMGSVALFAAGGKTIGKKDLGSIAMTYGNIYVAQVAMGYSDAQTVRAFVEAESYDGPSLIIAYSHCISMGFDLKKGYEHQKAAVQSGAWFLYRFDPRLAAQGRNPLQIDSRGLTLPVEDFVPTENRYNMLKKFGPRGGRDAMAEGATARRHPLGHPQATGRDEVRHREPVRPRRHRPGGPRGHRRADGHRYQHWPQPPCRWGRGQLRDADSISTTRMSERS